MAGALPRLASPQPLEIDNQVSTNDIARLALASNHAEMQNDHPLAPPDLPEAALSRGSLASAILPRASTLLLDTKAVPWVAFTPHCEAVEFRYIRLDPACGEIICLMRVPSGVRMPPRYQLGRTIVHTIEGQWKFEECDWIAGPGSVVLDPPASVRTPVALGQTGYCITLNVIRGDTVFFACGSDAPIIENWKSAQRRYLAHCELTNIQPADLTVSD